MVAQTQTQQQLYQHASEPKAVQQRAKVASVNLAQEKCSLTLYELDSERLLRTGCCKEHRAPLSTSRQAPIRPYLC